MNGQIEKSIKSESIDYYVLLLEEGRGNFEASSSRAPALLPPFEDPGTQGQ